MGRRWGSRGPVNVLFGCARRQSVKVKIFLGALTLLCSLVALKLLVRDHGHFFMESEATHAVRIVVHMYKIDIPSSTVRICPCLTVGNGTEIYQLDLRSNRGASGIQKGMGISWISSRMLLPEGGE